MNRFDAVIRALTAVNDFERILLLVVCLELFLGGAGRLIDFGGITLRMILFSLCMGYVATRIVADRNMELSLEIVRLLFAFLTVVSLATLVGIVNRGEIGTIAGDLKPLFYFPMILFFYQAIKDEQDIHLIYKLIIISAVVQALAYLILLSATHAGVLGYALVYESLSQSGEFSFRGDEHFFSGFFYKGFLFLCVGVIFVILNRDWMSRMLGVLMLASIALTFTRGFIASLAATAVIGWIAKTEHKRAAVIVVLMSICAFVLAFSTTTVLPELVQRPESDSVRIRDIRVFLEELNAEKMIWGHGLGALIGERERIEITYLEVLYKQGLIGLLFWIFVFAQISITFFGLEERYKDRAFPFWLATVFVYVQTATNPFLNNSIGMSVVLISAVVMVRLWSMSSSARLARGSASRLS